MASRTVRFISGADQMVICPYDHHHVIHSRNLGKHIRKCRKNYTGPELAGLRLQNFSRTRPAAHMPSMMSKPRLPSRDELQKRETRETHQNQARREVETKWKAECKRRSAEKGGISEINQAS
ncbi:hypothetical protein Bbelb_187200 [Branchiostoma belcheri]|nr:hypothetical protein Bbelb_187200 [Branchiostoma belcheri]